MSSELAPPSPLPAPRSLWAVGAAAAVLLAAALGWSAGAPRLWSGLLLNNFYFLSLALAAVVFVAIQYLTQAGWWVVVRRVPEAMAGFLPVAAVLMLGLYFGRGELYSWTRPEASRDALVAAKRAYLNTPFFFGRMVVIVAVWALFAFLLRRLSLRQDGDDAGGALAAHRRLGKLSAVFLPVFALTFALASFDWLMSLDPHWFSTIFAVYTFAGMFEAGIAAIALAVIALRRGPLAGRVHAAHLHDLGKLLFGFSIFWAYIWASQYLLIWYGNIPEEVTFYAARTTGPWAVVFWGGFALNWVIPFFVLLPRAAKRDPRVLGAVAGVVLVGHWVDLYMLIGPPVLGARPHLGPYELLLTAGYAGAFLYLLLRALSKAPLLAMKDPYLGESLAQH